MLSFYVIGIIPDELEQLTVLTWLQLQNNQLTGMPLDLDLNPRPVGDSWCEILRIEGTVVLRCVCHFA